MEHSPELLKPFANQLAHVAMQDDAAQTLRVLRLSGLLNQPSGIGREKPGEKPANPPSAALQEDRVGIWTRTKKGTHFTRTLDTLQQWPFWANVGRIEQRSAKKRVVLIGESVARGYLLDPQFTPAMALESILQAQMGKNAVEVIDLARTSMGFEIEQLAISALLLDPDAVIVFAGNNWLPPWRIKDSAYLGSTLLDHGIAGLKRLNESRLVEKIRETVGKISSAYKGRGVPLTWVVPEFNLGDWRDSPTNAPHLHQGGNDEWMLFSENAQVALREGDFKTASECAQKMVALDQDTCVGGLYILAECSREQWDVEAARNYLERARDALIWDPSSKSPRAYSVTQNTLREESEKHHDHLVDLPMTFREHLNGELPDSRLFLDYCHLTVEGIVTAMAATAWRVLHSLHQPVAGWRDLARHSATPPAKVKAEGAFLAAIHNAHWHQSYERARSYCLQALDLAPEIVPAMVQFLELQTRRAPLLMCRAAEELAGMDWPSIQNYLLRFNQQAIDRNLLNAIVDALRKHGIETDNRLKQLRREEHSVSCTQTNLLDYYYSSAAVQPQEEAWVNPGTAASSNRHYYRAYSRESRFFFIGEAFCRVRLGLTCRLPDGSKGPGTAVVAINGRECGEVELRDQWAAWDISVAGEDVQDGLNEIVVRWPLPVFPGKRGIEAAVGELLQELKPEFYVPFGEIHSFTADALPVAPTAAESTVAGADLAAQGALTAAANALPHRLND